MAQEDVFKKIVSHCKEYGFVFPSSEIYDGLVLLIAGLISFWVFPMFQSLNSGLYRVSDNDVMWTNQEHMIWSVESSTAFSGFLDFNWINVFRDENAWTNTADTAQKWGLELAILAASGSCSIALREVGRRKGWKLFWVNLGVAGLLFLPAFFVLPRIEVVMTLILFYALLLVFDIDPTMKEESLPLRQTAKSAVLSTEVYAAILTFAFFMIFVLSADAWNWLPSIFYTAQFAWRAWSMVGMSAVLIAVVICKLIKGRKLFIDIIAFASIALLALSQASVDKRISFANNGFHYKWWDDESMRNVRAIGAQNEYSPLVFYEIDHQPKYDDSLYYKVRSTLLYQTGFVRDIDRYIQPAFLEGSGDMVITELNTPDAKFDLTVDSEEAYIQLAQFYYEGYEITLSSDSGDEVIAPVYEDGLIAFRASQGQYKVSLHYIGSQTYRVLRPFFYISIAGVVGLGVGGYFWSKKKKKKEPETAEEETEETIEESAEEIAEN